LLFLIGIGFGCMPPLSATTLQNNVSIHTFGSAVATMQFSRNLCATLVVAVFGVLVLAGAAEGLGATPQYSAEGFGRAFFAAAASFAISLIAVLLMEEKPLQTKHA
jgi:sugar phosphate permease